jgi:hypothetical protein
MPSVAPGIMIYDLLSATTHSRHVKYLDAAMSKCHPTKARCLDKRGAAQELRQPVIYSKTPDEAFS